MMMQRRIFTKTRTEAEIYYRILTTKQQDKISFSRDQTSFLFLFNNSEEREESDYPTLTSHISYLVT